jgi:hypothetical protein
MIGYIRWTGTNFDNTIRAKFDEICLIHHVKLVNKCYNYQNLNKSYTIEFDGKYPSFIYFKSYKEKCIKSFLLNASGYLLEKNILHQINMIHPVK